MKTRRNLIQVCLLGAVLLPALTSGTQTVTKISGGSSHTLLLKSDGSLWAMGRNFHGELGDGTFNNTNRPELIVSNNVTAIAGGGGHSLYLKSDSSLWAMGYNAFGQLGDGTYAAIFPFGTDQRELILASNVTAIVGGAYHSLFLKSDGSLWGMGQNQYGQLGDGTFNNTNRPEMIMASNVTAIAVGEAHSLFLKRDGSLWAFGGNSTGQLGDGTTTSTNRPEQILPFLSGNDQLTVQLLSSGNVRLSFAGIAGTNYALDRSFSLAPANWVPQVTNPAGAGGVLVLTNTPNTASNNFWRIRSVP